MLFQIIILLRETRKLRCMHANPRSPVPQISSGCRMIAVTEISSIVRHRSISHIGRSFEKCEILTHRGRASPHLISFSSSLCISSCLCCMLQVFGVKRKKCWPLPPCSIRNRFPACRRGRSAIVQIGGHCRYLLLGGRWRNGNSRHRVQKSGLSV
jgi:hypothetical protein